MQPAHSLSPSLLETLSALGAAMDQASVLQEQLGFLPRVREALVARDLEGRILYWGPAAERLYGYTRSEAERALEHELLRSPWTHEALLELTRAGAWRGELRQIGHDGREFFVAAHWVLHRDEKGRHEAVIAHYHDRTSPQGISPGVPERYARLQTIFNQSFEFIGLLDAQGNLLKVNETARAAAGVSLDQVIGSPFWEAPWWSHSAELQARLRSAIAEAASGQMVRFEATHPRVGGGMLWVDFTLKPVFDGSGRVVWLIPEGRDITERKQAEEALKRQNEHLQDVDRLKGVFLSAVSHELRTPLASIKGYAEFLEDEIGGPLTPQQQDFVQQLERGVRRLEYLVDDLLDLTRIEAGTFRLSLAESDLTARVREDIDALYPQISEASLYLDTTLPPDPLWVVMDAQRIGQVLTNLLQNAIKFTPPQGRIQVWVEREAQGIRCTVRDTGHGIAPEDLPRLFQRFTQLENGRQMGTGTGLGLSISKAIVEGHGGQIGVESALGKGTTFWFTLPYQPPYGAC